jgi:hypothetical protein
MRNYHRSVLSFNKNVQTAGNFFQTFVISSRALIMKTIPRQIWQIRFTVVNIASVNELNRKLNYLTNNVTQLERD